MLQLSKNFQGKPIMSLRIGRPVAETVAPIINPNNLKIEGFFCLDYAEKRKPILLTQDIRDLLAQGFVIDDYEVLSDPDELVRLQNLLEINFQLIGKPVETVAHEKVGKVSDFAVETTTFYIQKIYIGQNLFKSFGGGQLSIDRTQIVEITDKKIIIQELLKSSKAGSPVVAPVT